MTTTYDYDKFTGLRPWYDEPCHWCDDGSPPAGEMPNTFGCVPACGSCIMAFEEDDAPEELAITLGDVLDPLTEAGLYAAGPEYWMFHYWKGG
jgi:hypothetical protein